MHPSTNSSWTLPDIADAWQWPEERIRQWQLDAFNRQLAAILPENAFYREKLGDSVVPLTSLEDLSQFPLTTKQELVAAAQQSSTGISPHHTFSPESYTRLHRTSGTTGNPLLILDTEADWRGWWSQTWQHVLRAAGVSPSDRVFLAFSFGPFIGFWSAHQACVDLGAMVIPGGGMPSLARLEFARKTEATVLCSTPSYALHLIEIAREHSFPLSSLSIQTLILAGETGGSVPAVRERLESEWQAKVIDHSGATEVGPWGFGWPDRPGLHVIETSFIAELLPVASEDSSEETLCELVLTSLGRLGAPVIRYRTGDAVRGHRPREGRCRFLWLPEGVLGRTDDMVTIRGVNIFPSSIDAIVREFPDVAEYRVHIQRRGALDELMIEIEGTEETRHQLEKTLQIQLGLRIAVQSAPTGSLPRFEAKARRWIDHR